MSGSGQRVVSRIVGSSYGAVIGFLARSVWQHRDGRHAITSAIFLDRDATILCQIAPGQCDVGHNHELARASYAEHYSSRAMTSALVGVDFEMDSRRPWAYDDVMMWISTKNAMISRRELEPSLLFLCHCNFARRPRHGRLQDPAEHRQLQCRLWHQLIAGQKTRGHLPGRVRRHRACFP